MSKKVKDVPVRELGNGLMSSVSILGTMTWGKGSFDEDEQSAFDQISKYLELVPNHPCIDTADLYPVGGLTPSVNGGGTETILGNYFAQHKGVREKVVVCTKVAGPMGPTSEVVRKRYITLGKEIPKDLNHMLAFTRESITIACDASLKRLQTDYIDLYQLHWPMRAAGLWGYEQYTEEMKQKNAASATMHKWNSESLKETCQTMGDLIKAGKIRHWGLSNETSFGICAYIMMCDQLNVPRPITVQNDFSLVDRRFEGQLAETCSHFNITLLSYGPLAGGTLSSKYDQDIVKNSKKIKIEAASERSRHHLRPNFQGRYAKERTVLAAKKYAKLALENDLSPTELALAWAYSRFYMGGVIIGSTNASQVEENVNAAKIVLSKEVLQAIDEIHTEVPNPNVYLNSSLMPKEQGINKL